MSLDNKEFEKELKAEKIERIRLLAEQLVQLEQKDYKDFKIDESKPIAYYNATIDILKKTVKNAKENKAALLKFDQTEQERKNLTPEELKQLQEEQAAINERLESIFATLDPVASLRGNKFKPNTIILRLRKNDPVFSARYPFGRLL